MEKIIALALNRFPITPHSLREEPHRDLPRSQISVALASLYHHYYLDTYGQLPPDPDPAQFEHLRFLVSTPEFRVHEDGIGASTSARRHRSNELGHAFCRWFLHDHLNITYFAHMERVLNRSLPRGYGSLHIERTASGDTPDYFCAESVDKIFLAEAKGRYSSVNFANSEFASWRKQFSRVAVKDAAGRVRSVKGYIVATRFATEENASVKSALFAEDPASPGDGELNEEERRTFGGVVMSAHYAEIAVKLNLPILAAALGNGVLVPEEIQFPVTVWEFQIPPLKGRRFVGGYYPSQGGALAAREVNGHVVFDVMDPLRLDVGRGTFFGVEEKIFRQVTGMARRGMSAAAEIPRFEEIQPFYSAISLLRDGSIVAPIEFLRPVERIVL